MKVLVATEKPFAAAAVNGIKAEVEAAGNELVLLEKYTEKAQLLDAVKDADAMIILVLATTTSIWQQPQLTMLLQRTLQDRMPMLLPNWFSACW